jgi:metal-responsive CopG/Arc/MetJ family transcriptional regulator
MERDGRRMLSTAFQADHELIRSLDEVARREGGSRSDAIRKLLILGIERYEQRERMMNALEDAQKVAV